MRAMIWLKLGMRIGGLKANASIDFWVNLIYIEEVISDFTCQVKANFCHTYRGNCFEEQAENRYIARLSISGVPFGG